MIDYFYMLISMYNAISNQRLFDVVVYRRILHQLKKTEIYLCLKFSFYFTGVLQKNLKLLKSEDGN